MNLMQHRWYDVSDYAKVRTLAYGAMFANEVMTLLNKLLQIQRKTRHYNKVGGM